MSKHHTVTRLLIDRRTQKPARDPKTGQIRMVTEEVPFTDAEIAEAEAARLVAAQAARAGDIRRKRQAALRALTDAALEAAKTDPAAPPAVKDYFQAIS